MNRSHPYPPNANAGAPPSFGGAARATDLEAAQHRANLCEEFLRLTQNENYTLVGAARALNQSPSRFSGPDSMLARYRRGGVAALVRDRRAAALLADNIGDLTRQIEALPWFIPAARFFYLNTNRTHNSGSVPEAIRRVIMLPRLPTGWKTATREKFLKAIFPNPRGIPENAANPPVAAAVTRRTRTRAARHPIHPFPSVSPDCGCPQPQRVPTHNPRPNAPAQFPSFAPAASAAPLRLNPATPLRSSAGSPLPACPPELRATILARQHAGQELVSDRIARQITINPTLVKLHRSPRDWSLANLTAPGSQRRYYNRITAQREIMQPGDWFGGDDATPGIAVCVPCNEVITPSSQKFGVLLGRFQWLAYHDARTDKILAHDYVVRPRNSYRAEDIVNGMGAVTRGHGIPRQGWQFEGGAWNSKLVRQVIALLDCQHWRTYSPHQKAIESIFNRVWTRLAVQFPHADMGRFRAENEANCHRYEACKKGHQDPRHYFPTLDLVWQVFQEEVAAHNTKPITSYQYGRWIPDEFFSTALTARPLRPFSPEMDWIFSPYTVERKVRGPLARCRVPMFENFSVPYEFSAPWMPLHHGKNVRLHFDPRQPNCVAKVILLETHGTFRAGQILGDASLIGETAGHIRLIMGWAADNPRAGYLMRQRTAQFMRRKTAAIGAGGRVKYSKDEQRDGLATVIKVEPTRPSPPPMPPISAENNRRTSAKFADSQSERAQQLRKLQEFEQQNAHLFH